MIFGRRDIEDLLPHREPFLFVDEVLELEKGKRVVATCTFPPDAFFFKGHFPRMPVVPGVLVVEAMAQAAGVLAYKSEGTTWCERGALLLRLDKVNFRRTVKPGEKIVMEVEIEHQRDPITKFKARATVDDKRCAEASIMATFTEPLGSAEENS